MRAFVTATALAGTLALTPVAALAQATQDQPQTPETQATEATRDAEALRVVTSPEELEGLDAAEVRLTPVEEAPRDMVPAIIAAIDPANQQASQLRERIEEHEGVQQALDEEDVEVERVVGAAVEENDLVVYILPEGETREQWSARIPDPTGDTGPGGGDADSPGEAGAADEGPEADTGDSN